MGRWFARGAVVALVLAVGVTLLVVTPAVGQRPSSTRLVKATSWAFLSLAQSSKHNAFAVGYSRLPSTAPIGEHWNGSAWVVTPMPHPSGGAVLYSVTAVPGTKDYLAGGESCTAAACPQAFLVKWDGSSWAQVSLPRLRGATDIGGVSASSATDAWAVGESCNYVRFKCNALLLHWNGTTWSQVTVPNLASIYPDLYAVADLSPTDVWAVGSSFLGSLALNWNGRSWVDVSVSSGGFTEGIDAVAAIPGTSEIWALEAASGGEFMLKWNGSGWKGFALPINSARLFESNVYDVGASSASNVWVVGNSYSGSGTQPSLTIRWSGGKWTAVRSPSPKPANELFGVVTTSSSSAFAGGVGYSPLQSSASGLLLQWNGVSWSRVKVPTPTVPANATRRAGVLTEGRNF